MRETRLAIWHVAAGLITTVCVLCAGGHVACADTLWVTPSGATIGGLPVAASADIINNFGTTYTVTLTNLEANPTSISQNLSGLQITFQNGGLVPIAPYYIGDEVTVAADGTFTPSGSFAEEFGAPWSTTNNRSFNSAIVSTNSATDTIIGPPGPGNVYSNANGSIAGNSAHNPFLTSLTWSFELIPTQGPTGPITGVSFQFDGNGQAFTIAGVDPPSANAVAGVPEPATWVTMLLGFAGLGFAFRKSRRKVAFA
jgi:hypothetical protein